jgi:toxin-antitoxin system PIN domain toxin
VILVDANLLIYAYDSSSENHAAARKWLEDAFSGPEPARLGWSSIHAFLRIVTHTAIYQRPMPMRDAVAIVESWLDQTTVGILEPGGAYWGILSALLVREQIRGPLVSDAHLAALAIEHGALLCTTDRDFRRFEGLRTKNPLE